MKELSIDWNTIFASWISNNEPASEIWKNSQLISKQTNNSIKKLTKGKNRYFTEEEIQVINKHDKMLNIINYQGKTNFF